MGATRNTGYLENLIAYDASNNVAIATTAIDNAFKITMGGSVKMTGALSGTSATFTYADNAYGAGITVTNSTNNTAAQSKINIVNSAGNLLALIQNSPSVNSGVAYIGTSGAYALTIGTNYATNLTISSTGAATFSSSVAVGAGMTIGISGTNDISWGTAGGIKLSRTNVGPEYALSQRWTGTLAYIDIASSTQWNGGVTILPNGGGNVGIGVTSTVGKLDIATGGNTNIVISNDSTDTGYNIVSLNGTRTKGSYAGIAGGGTGDNNLYLNSGSSVVIQTGASYTSRLTISSTGAATFSSSVQSNDNITISKAKAGVGVESTNLLTLRFTGTGAIGDSANIRFVSTDGSYTIASIGGISGADNIAYGSLAFTTRNYFTDSLVEVMRINNRGNVGIGTTAPSTALDVNGVINVRTNGYEFGRITTNNVTGNIGGLTFQYNSSGTFTPGMVLTGGGNVGIGTTSPTNYSLAGKFLDLNGGSDYAFYVATTTNAQGFWAMNNALNLGALFMYTNSPLTFGTNNTERMRITSGGKAELLIGTQTATWSGSNRALLELNGASSGTALLGLKINDSQRAYFYHNNTNLYIEQMVNPGSIYVISFSNGVYLTAGATSWTANSDERLKDITGNIENAVDSLLKLRTVKHTWKLDDTKKEHLALIAQDVEKVFPQVIDRNKLPSKANEEQTDNTDYLGVRYTELVPVLVKAIQELNQKIEVLENR